MFPARFFPGEFFAPHYFPEVGATAVAPQIENRPCLTMTTRISIKVAASQRANPVAAVLQRAGPVAVMTERGCDD